jgi:hypothetical protein
MTVAKLITALSLSHKRPQASGCQFQREYVHILFFIQNDTIDSYKQECTITCSVMIDASIRSQYAKIKGSQSNKM